MANLSQIVSDLEVQRKQVQYQLDRIDTAISAIRSLNDRNGTLRHPVRTVRSRRGLSVAARRRISQAKKTWWAKRAADGQTGTGAQGKRIVSAVARRRMAAAQRARWAKVKGQKKAA